MLAAWFEGGGTVDVRTTPVPRIEAPDQCPVRGATCGICGSDKQARGFDLMLNHPDEAIKVIVMPERG